MTTISALRAAIVSKNLRTPQKISSVGIAAPERPMAAATRSAIAWLSSAPASRPSSFRRAVSTGSAGVISAAACASSTIGQNVIPSP